MTVTQVHRGAGTPEDHVVQIYEREADLYREVGRYVAATLETGSVAVVIATAEHLSGFEIELARLGVDMPEAQRRDRVVCFDAAALLSAFVTAGSIDVEAFHSVIGGVVRPQIARGLGVRIYGEMVTLLWDAGEVVAAIELESLWNDLGATLPFSLLCAYPAASVLGTEHVAALQQVCGLHSSLLQGFAHDHGWPSAEVTATFSGDAAAVRAARHFVVDTLRRWGFPPQLLDDAALVSTELATNAVRHAASAFSLSLRVAHGAVRIAVEDHEPVDEARLIVRPERGLGLVAGVSLRWGVDSSSGGKVIWAELSPTLPMGPPSRDVWTGATSGR
jgi:anti-sigma regulatory factor (Ser/Thr protein kinase)